MLDNQTLSFLNTLLLIISTAFVILICMYVVFTIWRMFLGSKREDAKDPLENLKFSAVSSLTHIAVIGGFFVIVVMLSMFVFASKAKGVSEANTINLKDIIIQVIMLINSVISGLIGFFVRGQIDKSNEKQANASHITSNPDPNFGGAGYTSSTDSTS